MKPIAILCLFTIALNTALASMGSVLFCKHAEGNGHVISKVAHDEARHGDCCHHKDKRYDGDSYQTSECNSCTDTEIEGKELDEVTPNFDRVLVKSPPVLPCAFIQPSVSIPEARISKELHQARAPPIVSDATAEFAETIQFRV